MMKIVQLVYSSRMNIEPGGLTRLATFRQIHQTAVARNKLSNVSGFLVFTRNNFIQVLEGSQVDVQATFDRIKTDNRHTDFNIIDTLHCHSRAFPNWLMGAMHDDIVVQEAMLNAGISGNADLTRLSAKQIIAIFSVLSNRTEGVAA